MSESFAAELKNLIGYIGVLPKEKKLYIKSLALLVELHSTYFGAEVFNERRGNKHMIRNAWILTGALKYTARRSYAFSPAREPHVLYIALYEMHENTYIC